MNIYEAMQACALDESETELAFFKHLVRRVMPDDAEPTPATRRAFNEMVDRLKGEVSRRLADGRWQGSGFVAGQIHEHTPSAGWWASAWLEPSESTAGAYGVQLFNVDIREAGIPNPAAEAAQPQRKNPGPAPATTQRVVDAMVADIQSGKQTLEKLQRDTGEWLAGKYSVSRATARKALTLASEIVRDRRS